MKKILTTILGVAFIVVMAMTCPKFDSHVDSISEDLCKKNLIIKLIGKESVSFVIDKIINVDNYLFVSVGTYATNNKIVSFGCFSHVFVFTKDDFYEEVQRILAELKERRMDSTPYLSTEEKK